MTDRSLLDDTSIAPRSAYAPPAPARAAAPTAQRPAAPSAPRGTSGPSTVSPAGEEFIAHACVVEEPEHEKKPNRLVGIDVARSLALFGMICVHLVSESNDDGAMSLPWLLFAGTASALFAVLAGVGIAFSTGGTRRPSGRAWVRGMVQVGTRGLLIGALGLALGSVAGIDAGIILAFYGVLFVLAVPLLRMGPYALGALGMAIAIVMPIVSHLLRQGITTAPIMNPSFVDLFSDPMGTLTTLLLVGEYPALPWLAYICFGMAIGRSNLRGRWVMLRLTVAGITLAVVAAFTSWYLLYRAGGLEALAAAAMPTMKLDQFTDYLVWGADGTLPTDSLWWLAVSAPHTSTPVDLIYRTGIAMAVIGICVMLCVVVRNVFTPLAIFGSMPLSLYCAHLLLLTFPIMPENEFAVVAVHIAVLGAFAIIWRAFFERGPLEWLLTIISRRAGELVAGTPQPRQTSQLASPVRSRAHAGRRA